MNILVSLSIASQLSKPIAAVRLNWEALQHDLGYPLALMGMVVVFSALLLIVAFITALPRIVAWLDGQTTATSRNRTSPAVDAISSDAISSDAPASDVMTPQILAVVAAAVADAVVEPHRIVHTRPLSDAELAWAAEGRQMHHSSHRTRGSW